MDGTDFDRRLSHEPMDDGRRMEDARRESRHTVKNARQRIVALTERLTDEGAKLCAMLRSA